MFTGIIEEVNTVRTVAKLGNGRTLEINGTAAGMVVADTIVAMPRDKNDNPNDKVEMTIRKK